MSWSSQYLLFFLKLITTLGLFFLFFALIAAVAQRHSKSSKPKGKLHIDDLNAHYDEIKQAIEIHTLDHEAKKQRHKAEKEKAKQEKVTKQQEKKQKQPVAVKSKLFVIDFTGDIKASTVTSLRAEVTAILMTATPDDEVLIRLESAGGTVPGYGLAASQLKRLKDAHIPLTVAIDKVAASGGYMMACVADTILCAPFAIVGSIGVVTQLPNFHRFLKKHNIDFEQVTAGQFKRTLTLFGENSKEDRNKTQEMVDTTHALFKQFIHQHRPSIDLNKVATGEYWHGTTAHTLNLVDQLTTSDAYLLARHPDLAIYSVRYELKQSLVTRLSQTMQLKLTTWLSHVST